MKVVGAAFRFLAAGGAATACICTREAGADATARTSGCGTGIMYASGSATATNQAADIPRDRLTTS